MVKLFDFVVSDCGRDYKLSHDRKNELKAVSIREIERIINLECENIKSINVNTYVSHRHNNGDTDEVHIVYTVIC